MAITRQKKEEFLTELIQNLPKSKIVILVNYSGLNSEQIFELKKLLEKADANFKIIKNTLAKKACCDLKINIDPEIFQGTLAFIYGFSDEVEAAKTLAQFIKLEGKPEIMGAIYNNTWIAKLMVDKLSKIPDRKTLEAQLVGNISAPLSRLIYALKGNLYSLVSILNQYQQKL